MEVDARSFVRLGLLMNLLMIIAVVVLVNKAFSDSGRQAARAAVARAPVSKAADSAPKLAESAVTQEPAATPAVVVATATPEPLPTATAAPAATTNEATATTADAAVASDEVGTPAEPSQIVIDAVAKGTCSACHTIPGIPGAVGVVGPNLSNIGNDAATRISGYSAEQYLHESIVDPNAFVAPQCPFGACIAGSMPANLAQTLSEEEMNAVIVYLLTLKRGG
ncbi:MAG TPA: c-type cytochrome [Caldilineaceae bacterium]|nr:c-type cytochrome [Caldilineaceae bacterium]